MSVLIGIGIDYGVTGAVAAIGPARDDGSHRTAILHAHGAGGYHGSAPAGTLDPLRAREAMLSVLNAVRPDMSGDVSVFVCIERLLTLPGEGRGSNARTAIDWQTWCAVARLGDFRLMKLHAPAVDRRAGLQRRTVGRANRKAEIADYLAEWQQRGSLQPDLGLTPAGCRKPSQGARDALYLAIAAYRTIGGHL